MKKQIERSSRLQGLFQSDIRQMTRECEKLKGINLGQGVCDLPTPPLVRDGAIQAIKERKSTYSLPEGIHSLREQIAKKLKRENGIDADPENEIVVTAGATGGFADAVMALLNPGDGILLFEPYYGYHLNTAVITGLDPQFCTLTPPEFQITEENLRASLRENTRAIVLCTPSNPSGKMITEAEIEILAKVADEKNLLIITDEIYEHFKYEGRKHLSAVNFGALKDRTVTLMGLSKTFSITGWRLGYAYAKKEFAQVMTLVNDLLYVCAPTPLQHGVAAGFGAPPEFFEKMAKDFQQKRDRFCSALEEAGLSPIVPQGSYYVLADVSRLGCNDSREAAMTILKETKVSCVPGRAFYQSSVGESLVRFQFAVEDDVLEEACTRLKRFRT